MKIKIFFGILFVFALMSFVSAQTCTDSDGGVNEFVYGTTTYGSQGLSGGGDFCEGGGSTFVASRLIEKYCTQELSLEIQKITNYSAGKDEIRLRDEDGQVYEARISSEGEAYVILEGETYTFNYVDNPSVPDDEHLIFNGQTFNESDNIIFEIGGELKMATIDCENGCSDGVCRKSSGNDATTNVYICEDTESGKNYNLGGIIKHGWKAAQGRPSAWGADYCVNSNTLLEVYCENGYYGEESHVCSQGCNTPTNSILMDGSYFYPGACNPVQSTTCTENWQCGSWSACANNQQTRTCTDSNNCGTTTNKLSTSQSCSIQCTENWQCGSWSACANNQQTRTCIDSNNCGTTTNKPFLTQACNENYLISVNRIEKIGNINYLSMKDEQTGNVICENKKTGDICYIGNAELKIVAINELEESAIIKLISNGLIKSAYKERELSIRSNNLFLASLDEENYVLKITFVSNEDSITLKNALRGNVICTNKKTGDSCFIGDIEIKISSVNQSAEIVGIGIKKGNIREIYQEINFIPDRSTYLTLYDNSINPIELNIKSDSGQKTLSMLDKINENVICTNKKTGDSCFIGDIEIKILNITENQITLKTSSNHFLEKAYSERLFDRKLNKYFFVLPISKDSNTDACDSIGLRKSDYYCSSNLFWETQIEDGGSCENYFECRSYICVSNECVSANLIQKILHWFKRLFGAD